MDKPAQTEKRTLVEEGTELKGTLKSSCQVVVNGAIDGEIQAPALTVTQTGSVLGTVRAEKLHSEGTLAGDIDASDVYLSGTVRSNTMIRARTLEVKLAPERGKLEVNFGECLVEVGEDPAEQHQAADGSNEQVASPGAEAPAGGIASNEEQEPTWSEPPAMTAEAPPDPSSAEGNNESSNEERMSSSDEPTSDADEMASADSGDDDNGSRGKRKKKRKNNDARESQAPPA